MLTRFHKILIGALAVQLILLVIVWTRSDDSGALKEHPIIAGFDADKVTRVQVFASETAKPVDLVKKDAGWVMASSFDYPVEKTKVTDLLSPIAKLAAAAPLATQTTRHKQLKVDAAEYERKLVLTSDGKDLVLFIGAPAGARRTAVRLGGQDAVYAVTGITTSAAGTEPRQWVDPAYVKVPREDVARLVLKREGGEVEFSKAAPPPPPAPAGSGSGAGSGSNAGSAAGSAAGLALGSGSAAGSAAPPGPPAAEHWSATLDGAPVVLAAGETIDESTIERLVGEVAALDLNAPADPKRDASKPTATITLERKATGSSPTPTVIDVIADGTSYWVHDRSLPRAVLVDKARLDDLLGVNRDKIVKKPPPPPTPPPGLPGAGSGSAARPPTAIPMPRPTAPPAPGTGSAAKPG